MTRHRGVKTDADGAGGGPGASGGGDRACPCVGRGQPRNASDAISGGRPAGRPDRRPAATGSSAAPATSRAPAAPGGACRVVRDGCRNSGHPPHRGMGGGALRWVKFDGIPPRGASQSTRGPNPF